jgi:hypothetical protein
MGTRDFIWLWNTMLGGNSEDTVHVLRVGFQTKSKIPETSMQRDNEIRRIENLFMNAVYEQNQRDTVMQNTRASECRNVEGDKWEVFFVGTNVGENESQPSFKVWTDTALNIVKGSSIGTKRQWVDNVKVIRTIKPE